MFEETRKYTEEVYVSKEELAQRLDLTGVVLDAVWKQVEDYRALLRRSFCFDDLHADIVMTRALCAKLQQTTELLYRCPLQRPFSAAVQKSVLLAGNYPHWLYKAGELLGLAPLPQHGSASMACDISGAGGGAAVAAYLFSIHVYRRERLSGLPAGT